MSFFSTQFHRTRSGRSGFDPRAALLALALQALISACGDGQFTWKENIEAKEEPIQIGPQPQWDDTSSKWDESQWGT